MYQQEYIFYEELRSLPVSFIINPFKSTNKIIRTIQNVIYLRKILKKNSFDILHTILFYNGFWVRLLAPKKYNNRILYSVRSAADKKTHRFWWSEKFFAKKSIVVTNSLKGKEQIQLLLPRKYTDKVITIYNGFEIERFSYDREYSIPIPIEIGTVGRIVYIKNQIQILEALYNLKNEIDFHFYLIGAKDDVKTNQDIQDFINSNFDVGTVSLLDPLNDIEAYYRKFNIFILSSRFEGCPNVLFEAMLAKCLCIISDSANTDNFIKDSVNGLVYDNSTDDLKCKIIQAIKILNNPPDLVRIQNNAYNFCITKFSINTMANSYIDVYEDMLR
jgi:glycosyltransferase involved in cell wall biosynthesis